MNSTKKLKNSLPANFNVQTFLESAGVARTILEFQAKDTIFSQGDIGKEVMYIQKGTVKLSVVSKTGKEAVVAMLKPGSFVGEGSLAGQPLRIATATAVTPVILLVIGLTETLTGSYISYGFKDVFTFIIMIAMLLLRPQGLLGARRT